jgi:DNA-binding NtrC family response regulator
VGAEDLPAEIWQAAGRRAESPIQAVDGTPRTMDEIERQAILETLSRTGGHRAQAANLLGIGLRTLQRKLKDYKDQGFWND